MRKIILAGMSLVMMASLSLAATYDISVGGTNGYPDYYGRKLTTIERHFNLASGGINYATGSVIEVIAVPATSVIMGVTYSMPIASTNNSIWALGRSDNSTVMNATIDSTNAVWAAATLYATPYFTPVNEYITLKITEGGDPSGYVGEFDIKVLILDANSYQNN